MSNTGRLARLTLARDDICVTHDGAVSVHNNM